MADLTASPPFAAIADYVDRHFAEEVEFLARLVRCPSDNPPGDCAAHAVLAAGLLEEMGFTVERHPVPAETAARAGMASVVNLIVRRPFGDGPVVALNAHGDVVPPGGGWTTDPYGAEIRDGWLYGRGAAVSKSDFATFAFALRALEAAGVPLAGTVELHFTYDEETGGAVGPAWLLEQGLSKPDYAIAAGFSYELTIAHNGCLHLEVTVRGRSAHAARPDTGCDALEATSHLLAALYRHRDEIAGRRSLIPGISHPTLVVGTIAGGINTNVVPDAVTLRIDRRIIPEEPVAEAEAAVRAAIQAGLAGRAGITVEIRRLLLARPLAPVAGGERLRQALQRAAAAAMGEPVPAVGVPLYADARLYAEAGIPTVMYGAGPRSLLEANGHRADERVPLDSLKRATKAVAWALLDLLRPSGGSSAA